MLRRLQLIVAVLILTLGVIGGAGASQEFHAVVSDASEYGVNPAEAQSINAAALYAHQDHGSPEHCQGDSIHAHCISCTAMLSSLSITDLPPSSIYHVAVRPFATTLVIDPIEYPPK